VGVARPEQEIFSFRIGALRLAFAAINVREVVRCTPLTPLPRTPAFLLGVMGHRGEVLPVVDLLRFLGKGELKPGPRSRVVIGVSSEFVAGFLADAVVGMLQIPSAEIVPAPLGNDAASEYLDGVVASADKDRKEPLHLLTLPKLLQAIRQRVVTR
jgi:purine-binding chemotaxis protein CheW